MEGLMSNEAIAWAFKQDLPMAEKFVLVALADYADDRNMCFPSHKKTAQRVGASVDTVKRSVRSLRDQGYLSVYAWKRDNGSSTSNRYHLKVGGQTAPPVQEQPQDGYSDAPPARGTSAPPNNPQLTPHLVSAKKSSGKAMQLPASWAPTDEHIQKAKESGLNLNAEAEKFRLHAEATGRKMVRWNAAFTSWLIKAAEFRGPTIPMGRPTQGSWMTPRKAS